MVKEVCRVEATIATTSKIFYSDFLTDEEGQPVKGMMVSFNIIVGQFNLDYLMENVIPAYNCIPWNALFGIGGFDGNPDGNMLAQAFIPVPDDSHILHRGTRCEISFNFRQRNKQGTEKKPWPDDPENPDLFGLKLQVDPKSIKVFPAQKPTDIATFFKSSSPEDEQIIVYAERSETSKIPY